MGGAGSRPRIRDLAAGLGFLLLWILPLSVSAWRGRAPQSWPLQVQDLYSVSCLFGQASERTSVFYVQVRFAGQVGWRDLDEGEWFGLEPFGHRTRFDRFMARLGYQSWQGPAREELGAWLAARYAEAHPDAPPIVALRYVWGDVTVDPEAPPTGCWEKPPRAQVQPIRQLGEIVVLGREETQP